MLDTPELSTAWVAWPGVVQQSVPLGQRFVRPDLLRLAVRENEVAEQLLLVGEQVLPLPDHVARRDEGLEAYAQREQQQLAFEYANELLGQQVPRVVVLVVVRVRRQRADPVVETEHVVVVLVVVVVLDVLVLLELIQRHPGLRGEAGLLVAVPLRWQLAEERVLPALQQVAHDVAALQRAGDVAVDRPKQRALEPDGGIGWQVLQRVGGGDGVHDAARVPEHGSKTRVRGSERSGNQEAAVGEFVRLEVDGAVGTIRLDRPKMNALNAQVQEEIRQCALDATADPAVRAVVLYGGERVFAAGADIKEMKDMSYVDMLARAGRLQDCFQTVARIPKPVIAAITGYALGGGCELSMCADFRVVADNAKLGQPEILLGIIPGAGGTQRLTRLVGPAKAKDLCFTGRFVDAQEALAIGLADRVVPAADVYSTAVEMAASYANGPAIALHAAKRAVDEGIEMDLDAALRLETTLFAGLFATEDRRIGMDSFVENGPGKAVFTGR